MSIIYRRLNHITINVPPGEHEKVRWFYGQVMEFQEISFPDSLERHYDLIWFSFLDLILHVDFSPPFTPTLESRHFALEVKDLENVKKTYQKRGADIREAVLIPDRGRFYIVDPFGNYIEILELKS